MKQETYRVQVAFKVHNYSFEPGDVLSIEWVNQEATLCWLADPSLGDSSEMPLTVGEFNLIHGYLTPLTEYVAENATLPKGSEPVTADRVLKALRKEPNLLALVIHKLAGMLVIGPWKPPHDGTAAVAMERWAAGTTNGVRTIHVAKVYKTVGGDGLERGQWWWEVHGSTIRRMASSRQEAMDAADKHLTEQFDVVFHTVAHDDPNYHEPDP